VSPPALDSRAEKSLAPYEAILEHAELELELAGRGELERLVEMAARWEELTHELPSAPPASAAPLLTRAQLVHERTRIELIRLREALLEDLATTGRAKRAAGGYGSQLRRRPHLDRSA
jgi:hypothetical protein